MRLGCRDEAGERERGGNERSEMGYCVLLAPQQQAVYRCVCPGLLYKHYALQHYSLVQHPREHRPPTEKGRTSEADMACSDTRWAQAVQVVVAKTLTM